MSKIISITPIREVNGKTLPPPHAVRKTSYSRRTTLNHLCASLADPENQRRFRSFTEGYCRDFGLSLEQIHAVTDFDVVRLLRLGISSSSLRLLFSVCGLNVQSQCQEQTGRPLSEILREH